MHFPVFKFLVSLIFHGVPQYMHIGKNKIHQEFKHWKTNMSFLYSIYTLGLLIGGIS